jgi:hypothetical protein
MPRSTAAAIPYGEVNSKSFQRRWGDDLSNRYGRRSHAALLGALVALGCRRNPTRDQLPSPGFSPRPDAAVPVGTPQVSASGDTASLPPDASTARGAWGSKAFPSAYDEERRTVKQRARVLRAALAANDRERFANALFYPVRVNTESRCSTSLTNPKAFLRHFDAILTPKIRRALEQPGGPEESGFSLGNGEIWFLNDHAPLSTAFNLDVWEIEGVRCEGWQLSPVPRWLNGTWRVSSVAEVGGTSEKDPPTQWNDGSVRVDLARGQVELALSRQEIAHCKPLRFGVELTEARMPDAARHGFESDLRMSDFFDLECSARGKRYWQRIDVLGRSLLSLWGNDAFLVFVKPEATIGRPSKIVAAGQPCGMRSMRCGKDSVCLATPDQPGRPREECRLLSSLVWGGAK